MRRLKAPSTNASNGQLILIAPYLSKRAIFGYPHIGVRTLAQGSFIPILWQPNGCWWLRLEVPLPLLAPCSHRESSRPNGGTILARTRQEAPCLLEPRTDKAPWRLSITPGPWQQHTKGGKRNDLIVTSNYLVSTARVSSLHLPLTSKTKRQQCRT